MQEHTPLAAILGCADARVAAELIFDRGPGDLFMVRVAGNFLSEYGLASMEYAVRFLEVPLLLVLGHTQCGALSTAVKIVEERSHLPGRLPYLIDAVEPAVHIAQREEPARSAARRHRGKRPPPGATPDARSRRSSMKRRLPARPKWSAPCMSWRRAGWCWWSRS